MPVTVKGTEQVREDKPSKVQEMKKLKMKVMKK